MADTIGTVRVELIADPSGIQRGIEQASGALTRFAAIGSFVGNVLANAFAQFTAKFVEMGRELLSGEGAIWERLSADAQSSIGTIASAFQTLQSSFIPVIADLVNRLAPAFASLVDVFNKVAVESGLLQLAFNVLVGGLKFLAITFNDVVAAVQILTEAFATLGRVAGAVGTAIANALRLALGGDLAGAGAALAGAWNEARRQVEEGGRRIGEVHADVIARNQRIWESGGAGIRNVVGKIGEETAKVGEGFDRLAHQAQRVFEATRTPLERFAVEVGKLQTLLSKGLIDEDTFNRAVDMANDKISGLRDTMRSLAQSMSGAFTDAILGAKSFGEAVRDLLRDIARLLLNKVFQQLLLGAGGGTQGPTGGLLGSLFGGGRAGGGSVSAGKLYAVGERGPELFMPSMAGTIIPNHAIGAGGGDMKVTVNNYGNDQVDVRRRSDDELEIIIGGMVDKRLSESGGRGALGNTYGIRPRTRNRG